MMLGITVAAFICILVAFFSATAAHDAAVKSYREQTDGMIFVIKQYMAAAWTGFILGIALLCWSGYLGYEQVWIEGKDSFIAKPPTKVEDIEK